MIYEDQDVTVREGTLWVDTYEKRPNGYVHLEQNGKPWDWLEVPEEAMETFFREVPMSKEMKSFSTGAKREDKTGKGRCDLLPPAALIRLSKHFEKGAEDHGDRNWELGIPMHSFIDSGLRHLLQYMDGQTDEDHLCAAAWNILCALETEEKRPEMQDIPARIQTSKPSDCMMVSVTMGEDTIIESFLKDFGNAMRHTESNIIANTDAKESKE